MKKLTPALSLLLIALLTGTIASAQSKKCPDLEVRSITVDTVAPRNPCCIRFRVVVKIENVGRVAYAPSSAYGVTRINFSVTAPGYSNRPLATQPVSAVIAPGGTNIMIYEVDVDRVSHKLPEWEDMPLPTSYCGYITSDNVPPSYECSLANNRLCAKNNAAIRKWLK